MGVRSEVYFMVGVDINEKIDDEFIQKLEDDGLLKYKAEVGHLHCLLDGMSAEYAIVGEVVGIGDEYEGLNLTSLSVEEFNIISQRVHDHLFSNYKINDIPMVYVVTHWH